MESFLAHILSPCFSSHFFGFLGFLGNDGPDVVQKRDPALISIGFFIEAQI
jgi:hypothetical protein